MFNFSMQTVGISEAIDGLIGLKEQDDFFDPYFGRIYADPNTKKYSKEGLEVITRSFQMLFRPYKSREFLEKDFELFAFTLGLFLRSGK